MILRQNIRSNCSCSHRIPLAKAAPYHQLTLNQRVQGSNSLHTHHPVTSRDSLPLRRGKNTTFQRFSGLRLRRFESYFPHHPVSPRDGLCLPRAKWWVFQRLTASVTPLWARPRRGKPADNTASLALWNGFFHFSGRGSAETVRTSQRPVRIKWARSPPCGIEFT